MMDSLKKEKAGAGAVYLCSEVPKVIVSDLVLAHEVPWVLDDSRPHNYPAKKQALNSIIKCAGDGMCLPHQGCIYLKTGKGGLAAVVPVGTF